MCALMCVLAVGLPMCPTLACTRAVRGMCQIPHTTLFEGLNVSACTVGLADLWHR